MHLIQIQLPMNITDLRRIVALQRKMEAAQRELRKIDKQLRSLRA